jgi:hypothetical protein
MKVKIKTAAEWLLHLPPKYREAVRVARNEYRAEEGGAWDTLYVSLRQMVFFSKSVIIDFKSEDPLWNEIYALIEAGEFKEPWQEAGPQPEPTVYDKYPIGSRWRVEVIVEVEASDPNDRRMPIYIRPTEVGGWLTPCELDKLKPLNP